MATEIGHKVGYYSPEGWTAFCYQSNCGGKSVLIPHFPDSLAYGNVSCGSYGVQVSEFICYCVS